MPVPPILSDVMVVRRVCVVAMDLPPVRRVYKVMRCIGSHVKCTGVYVHAQIVMC